MTDPLNYRVHALAEKVCAAANSPSLKVNEFAEASKHPLFWQGLIWSHLNSRGETVSTVADPGLVNAAVVNALAHVYAADGTGSRSASGIVADVCDEVLDPSGGMLGQVRDRARQIVDERLARDNADGR